MRAFRLMMLVTAFTAATLSTAAGQPAGRPAPTPVLWPKDKKAPELPKPGDDGFVNLFNGKDLTNWEGLDGFWSVKDGAIEGSATREKSKQTFLVLSASWAEPTKFADFELHCKYKFTTTTGNSGVQFRSRVIEGPVYRVGGYQADIDAATQYDGGLYDEAGVAGNRGIMANRGDKTTWNAENKRTNEPLGKKSADLRTAIKKGDWNAMILSVKGNTTTVSINGEQMSNVVDDSPKAVKDGGVIAFQMHSGQTMTIQWKDVKIKLPKS